MEKLYQDYKDIADFRMIYIREAHPADGNRPTRFSIEKKITQQTTYHDRCTTAESLLKSKKLTVPMLVDGMDNKTNLAYSAEPDRVFLVRTDGRLAVAADRGPRGFKPGLIAVEAWLAEFRKSSKEPELPE